MVTTIGIEATREALEEEADNTWDPVLRMSHDTPAVLRRELKVMQLKAEQKRALVQRYGLCL